MGANMDDESNKNKIQIQVVPEPILCIENGDDYITSSIGAFGCWQCLYIVIAASTRLIASVNTTSIVFLTPETDFVCKKFSDNATINIKNNTCYENCDEYMYTNDVFDDSLISEFGLICNKEWLVSLTQSTMMFGLLCGVFLFGWLSDRFGRSKAMIFAGLASAIFMFVTPFCPDYWSFIAARFFSGLGTGGYLALTVVYMSELVGTRMIDTVICIASLTFDGAGLPLQAGFAYITTTWRNFMIVCSSMTVMIVSITFFLPETPRWLIAKKRSTEAIDLMTRACRMNKRDSSNVCGSVTTITDQLNLKETNDVHLTYLDLFRTKKLALCTVISVSLWFVTGFSYFGLVQYVSQFGSNLYIVVSILGLSQIIVLFQIIAAPMSVAVVKFFGRKTSSMGLYASIGAFSVALCFTPKGSVEAVALGTLGVIAATTSFSVVYIIVIELYPTSVRNMGLSLSSVGSKIAAVVAPFVVNMKTQWMASSIFAVAGFSAVLFSLFLPETKGNKLKDTIEEFE